MENRFINNEKLIQSLVKKEQNNNNFNINKNIFIISCEILILVVLIGIFIQSFFYYKSLTKSLEDLNSSIEHLATDNSIIKENSEIILGDINDLESNIHESEADLLSRTFIFNSKEYLVPLGYCVKNNTIIDVSSEISYDVISISEDVNVIEIIPNQDSLFLYLEKVSNNFDINSSVLFEKVLEYKNNNGFYPKFVNLNDLEGLSDFLLEVGMEY